MTKIEDAVTSAIGGMIEELGYELVEVKFFNHSGQDNLTLFIDSKSGVGLDDCEKVHRNVDVILDEINPTKDKPYNLNVSSCGLDRPIKSEKDFLRNIGKKLELKLFAPIDRKKTLGVVIKIYNKDNVVFERLDNGQELVLEHNKIALLTQLIEF